VFFKWQDVRSCSLRYNRDNKTDYDGSASFQVDRILTFKVTHLEGEVQSISITFKNKLRYAFRGEKEEKVFREFIQNIVESFTIEPTGYQRNFKYQWVIQG